MDVNTKKHTQNQTYRKMVKLVQLARMVKLTGNKGIKTFFENFKFTFRHVHSRASGSYAPGEAPMYLRHIGTLQYSNSTEGSVVKHQGPPDILLLGLRQ